MNILIIEDEPLAAKRLEQLVLGHKGYEVVKKTDSVKSTVAWLNDNQPDLAFFDIQLADGLSFEIFEKTKITCPVIFTTAFDEYALKAFKVNSVDYLLKPIDAKELSVALDKFEKNFKNNVPNIDLAQMRQVIAQLSRSDYKERFVIKVGEHIKSIKTNDLLYLVSEDKTTFAVDQAGKRHILDSSLDELQNQLDPKHFFRISRKYIVHLEAMNDIIAYSNSRLKLVLKMCDDNAVIVSRERVVDFKEWLDR